MQFLSNFLWEWSSVFFDGAAFVRILDLIDAGKSSILGMDRDFVDLRDCAMVPLVLVFVVACVRSTVGTDRIVKDFLQCFESNVCVVLWDGRTQDTFADLS